MPRLSIQPMVTMLQTIDPDPLLDAVIWPFSVRIDDEKKLSTPETTVADVMLPVGELTL